MPKDYAKYTRKRKNKKSRKIFLFILIIIFSAGGVFYFQSHLKHAKKTAKKTASIIKAPIKTKSSKKKPLPKVHFDFYTLLPKMKVEVLTDQNEKTTVQKNTASYYVLQIASLSDKNEAAAYQKKINQLGFSTKIFTVSQNNAQRYRIEMGPFKDQQSAQAMQNQLQQKDIDGVILKVTD